MLPTVCSPFTVIRLQTLTQTTTMQTILDSIPEEEVNDRLRRVWAVKRHLTYNVIPESGDAYDFTLLELFMRQVR